MTIHEYYAIHMTVITAEYHNIVHVVVTHWCLIGLLAGRSTQLYISGVVTSRVLWLPNNITFRIPVI